MFRAFCAVALVALACLSVRAGRVGISGELIDPVGNLGAQDEALYAHSAIHMAREGGWLTPTYLGRYALSKPPLLMWASGLSARLLGISRLALRLPVALLCSMAAGLVFLWAAEIRSWQAGLCAAALLVSDHLWHVLGGMCMTDGLLVAFYAAAMYALFSDPWLESKAAFWGLAVSTAAAILTKSVAGVLPLGALGLYWLLAPRKQRPRFARVCLAAAVSFGLAAPWFVYQMAVHPRWFWAEHVGIEILAYGASAPPQTSHENHVLFYAMRLALLDPVLTAAALLALPWFVAELRRRSGSAVMLLCWLVVPAAAAFAWQYRSVTYLLPLMPALAILAACYALPAARRSAYAMPALIAAAFVVKALFPVQPWGLRFEAGSDVAVAPLLSEYSELGRGNELVLVDADDELYASVLPLPKIRFAYVGTIAQPDKYGLDFAGIGIALTAAQYEDLPHWEPVFRDRLRSWGLDSPEPIGMVVLAASPGELARMIEAHPDTDFLLPERFRAGVASAPGHDVVTASRDRFFLLSRRVLPAPPRPWSSRL